MAEQVPFTPGRGGCASSTRPIKPPTIWDWIVFYILSFIHSGSPIINALFRFKPKFAPEQMDDKTGEVVLITGANTGTGYETAKAYYEHGAKVYLACRSEQRALTAIEDIKKGGSMNELNEIVYNPTPHKSLGSLEYINLDLADLNTVDQAAQKILARENRLDVLFANAGIMTAPPGEFTKQGYSLQFGTNVVGHQRLMSHLLPLLKRTSQANPTKPSRIISVSGIAHKVAPRGSPSEGGIKYDSLKRGDTLLSSKTEYGESKWGNIALVNYIDEHHGPQSGVTDGEVLAFSVHTGFVSTDLSHTPWLPFIKKWPEILSIKPLTARQGALNALWAGNMSLPNARKYSGKYISGVQSITPVRPDLRYPQAWDKLWNWCEVEAKRVQ